jgi:hypothetical protein
VLRWCAEGLAASRLSLGVIGDDYGNQRLMAMYIPLIQMTAGSVVVHCVNAQPLPPSRKGNVMHVFQDGLQTIARRRSLETSGFDPMKPLTHSDSDSLPPSDSCPAIWRQPLASENGGNGGRQSVVTNGARRRGQDGPEQRAKWAMRNVQFDMKMQAIG